MKKLFILLLLINFIAQAQTKRVLIVGDTWAHDQVEDDVHSVVFSNNGFANIIVEGSTTARSESEASVWATQLELDIIAAALSTNPDIDTVQLTVGGYDFLNNWSASMSTQQEEALQQQILTDITAIVDFILAQDANIEIVLSFYDYPNFVDTLLPLAGFECETLLTNLGTPSTSMINTAVSNFESIYAQAAANNPRVYYVSHIGLMQNFYDAVPLPGNTSLPSPVDAMLEIATDVFDCIRLSPMSYEVIVENLFDGYYQTRFDTVFKSGFE